MNKEPNEISEDEYLDRMSRPYDRLKHERDTADIIRDQKIEDELLEWNKRNTNSER